MRWTPVGKGWLKMTKIDIISGFLGAGKTTLIKKLLKEALAGTKVVLIENEFGQIGIDGGFLKESGIEIKEMNSGCICCSLVGDFGTSLLEVLDTYQPERILIEPSGVGKLSDVMKAVENVKADGEAHLNSAVVVVDASKCKMYMKNFGEFFINQIEYAGTVILSRTAAMKQEKIEEAVALIRQHNGKATVITTPWEELEGGMILETIEGASDLEAELMQEVLAHREEHHHHDEEHHHDHGEGCHHDEEHHHHHGEECGHHHGQEEGHHHGEKCCEHHGDECGHHHGHEEEHHHGHEAEHHHHHDHGEECGCGCHDHHNYGHHHDHGHHHADEVFTSWGMETAAVYDRDRIEDILEELDREKEYGIVLRAKGMVPSADGSWIHFDYVPGEVQVRMGAADVTGKLCVIGSGLKEEALEALFLGK
jgi:G3E family GTPase